MIPSDKITKIVNKYESLEKELASSDISKKDFVKKSKEYSSIGEIIDVARSYLVFDKGKNANIMSYFKGYRDDGSAYKTGMFKEQIDMVTSNLRFSARLYLKNYSWE